MLIKDVFAADVTRNIAPVVYFHEQDPEKVAEEVSEYIITGGYPEGDPRHKRVQAGIHEQFVHLLKGLAEELQKGKTALPASWISGFYGSGKSSFAKLLGLALDGLELPGGISLGEALLARDESPRSQEFREAWEKVVGQITPISVVFDVGSMARDDEHIHSVVKREVQRRLGYCSVSHYVADHELKLELDGQWESFLQCAEETLGNSWNQIKDKQLAEEDFSHVMHRMNPDRYLDPLSWFDSRAGSQTGIGTSVAETTRAISDMLRLRSPGKTLFVVVDEVSQYIYQDTDRMLRLQSFVEDLGKKLQGQVWLLATGQQKLEDDAEESGIGKLKDRFPSRLRVHLAPTNIRDVVHKRLLKKAQDKEAELRDLFQQHRSDLKLYGYKCESITEDDFLEVYPMLPGYVDLLMQITSNLRTRSTRAKGDDHAIRGLLQLLGELFREQHLGEQPLGYLVTLDRIFEVQQTALDPDVQNTLARLLSHEEVMNDELAIRVAKTVALLELIQEQEPTTPALISQCLYSRLGMGNQESVISEALEKLKGLNLLSYSEKQGYKIQSSAGQEWQRERDAYSVTPDGISAVVEDKLKELLGSIDRPRLKSNAFQWAAFYSDGRQRQDTRLQVPRDLVVITVDFRFLSNADDRDSSKWIRESGSETLRDRLIWVVGKLGTLPSDVRELVRSRNIIQRYGSRHSSLSTERQRLLLDEQVRFEGLERRVKDTVAQAFLDGEIYFRGRQIDKQRYGSGFGSLLYSAGEDLVAELYDRYVDIAVIPSELNQLLEPNLSGPSQKFMREGLGILDLDGGKFVPSCNGEVPARIGHYVVEQNGISGAALLTHFGGPPYGYAPDMVKACLVGLLRAGKIRIRPDQGAEITSIRDPGTKDIFTKERDLKRADILPPTESGINPRDRVKICTFFQEALGVELDRENDAIADAVFQQFPNQSNRLKELERKYNQLPGRPDLPGAVAKLGNALEKCSRSRQVEDTVLAVKKHLDDLREGIQQLGILLTDLSDENVAAVRRLMELQENQVAQLRDVDGLEEIKESVEAIERQLSYDRPWVEINTMERHVKAIEEHYRAVRLSLIERQENQAKVIQDQIKRRNGFSKLSEDKASYVLDPVRKAMAGTTPEVLYPALLQLRDSAQLKLLDAEQKANRSLDDALSETTQVQVISLPHNLTNREVSTPEEVEALVGQLRERLLATLKENVRIRLN